jgi:hypothetical protein
VQLKLPFVSLFNFGTAKQTILRQTRLGTVPATSHYHNGRSANTASVKFIQNKAKTVLRFRLLEKTK